MRAQAGAAAPRWARERNMVFREARQNRQQEFPGMSRSGLRTLVRKDIVELLARRVRGHPR